MHRLLHPRTIAVVGANDREGSYSGETLLNLRRLGYPGTVWGVNPGREEAHATRFFGALRVAAAKETKSENRPCARGLGRSIYTPPLAHSGCTKRCPSKS